MSKPAKPLLSILFVAFALTLTATPLVAAEEPASETGKPGAEELADWMVGELTGPLGLSESQVEQIRPVLVADVERVESIFAEHRGRQGDGGAAELEQRIAESKAQTMAALEPILSPEQLALLKEIQKEREDEVGGALIVHRLQGLLDLTPEQRDQLAPIFAEDLRQRRELMRQAGIASDDPHARRNVPAEMRKLQEQLEGRLAPILSQTQMTAYREYQNAMYQEMRERMKGARKGR